MAYKSAGVSAGCGREPRLATVIFNLRVFKPAHPLVRLEKEAWLRGRAAADRKARAALDGGAGLNRAGKTHVIDRLSFFLLAGWLACRRFESGLKRKRDQEGSEGREET